MLSNFLLQLNMAKRRHDFLALWILKPRRKLNLGKNKICFDLKLSSGVGENSAIISKRSINQSVHAATITLG